MLAITWISWIDSLTTNKAIAHTLVDMFYFLVMSGTNKSPHAGRHRDSSLVENLYSSNYKWHSHKRFIFIPLRHKSGITATDQTYTILTFRIRLINGRYFNFSLSYRCFSMQKVIIKAVISVVVYLWLWLMTGESRPNVTSQMPHLN